MLIISYFVCSFTKFLIVSVCMNLRSGKLLSKSKMPRSDTNTTHTQISTQNVDVIPVSTTTQSATVLSPVRLTIVHGSGITITLIEPRHGISPFDPNRPLFPGGP